MDFLHFELIVHAMRLSPEGTARCRHFMAKFQTNLTNLANSMSMHSLHADEQ
jgi:hypothetical protein